MAKEQKTAAAPAVAARDNRKRTQTGFVVSDRMQKTIVVQVSRRFAHPLFGKVLERFKKYKVHDEKNEAKAGDMVEIEECRPLSREKRWRLVAIVKKQARQIAKPGESSPQET